MSLDYLQPSSTAIGIISAFVATVIGMHFKEHKIAKVVLLAVAGIAGVVAIGATFYGQHQIMSEREADAQRAKDASERRTDIRDELANLIRQGVQLMLLCGDASKPAPNQAADEWGDRVVKFLRDKLGEAYVSRVINPSGPPIASLGSADKDHGDLWRAIYVINFHLEEFSREFSP